MGVCVCVGGGAGGLRERETANSKEGNGDARMRFWYDAPLHLQEMSWEDWPIHYEWLGAGHNGLAAEELLSIVQNSISQINVLVIDFRMK